MAQVNTLDFSSLVEETRATLEQLDMPLRQSGPEALTVRNALVTLADDLNGIVEAKSKASIISSDPRFNADYKVKQIKALVGDAYDDATRQAVDLNLLRGKAYEALTRKLLPARPSGADSAMLAFQAGEASKVIEAAGSSSACINAVAGMLSNALAKGDDLLVYILAGGVLDLTYRRLISNQQMLAAKIQEVLQSAQKDPTAASGAALIPVLKDGADGTLFSLARRVQQVLGWERTAYEAWLRNAAQVGSLNGIWEGGLPRR